MFRTLVGVLSGFLATVAVALLLTLVAGEFWPSTWSRLPGESTWYVSAATLLLAHLGAGLVGGFLVSGVAAKNSRTATHAVAVLVSAYLLFQILGDWGHHFRFFSNALLGVATVSGIYAASFVRRQPFTC